jgi:glycosyltransferase involved in cell wall biosynthesis
MRIVLISASSSPQEQEASAYLEQAFSHLNDRSGGNEWAIFRPQSPGALIFPGRWKNAAALKRLQPDVILIVSLQHLYLQGNYPAYLFVGDETSPARPSLKKELSSLAGFITVSNHIKDQLVSRFDVSGEKVVVLPAACRPLPASALDVTQVREKFTAGNEYILYIGSVDAGGEWERVLQAFSLFRKWQQSTLQLVLKGPVDAEYRAIFTEKLSTYKHRRDVLVIDNDDEATSRELASAAFMVLFAADGFRNRMALPGILSTGVPVIVRQHPLTEELAGQACLYAGWSKAGELSRQIIQLYKDEDLYNRLAAAAKKAGASQWDEMTTQLQLLLQSAAER